MAKKKMSLYAKHSLIYYFYEFLRWSSVLTPFLVLYLNKKDEWFVTVEGQTETTKMTIGMVILIGILGWTVLREMAKKKGRSHTPTSAAPGQTNCVRILLRAVLICTLIWT